MTFLCFICILIQLDVHEGDVRVTKIQKEMIFLLIEIIIFTCAVLLLIKTFTKGSGRTVSHVLFHTAGVGCGFALDCATACEIGGDMAFSSVV